ncbi:MAG: 16S rRNA (cytosine(1402)-N(4))-methyltransferase RsmH [Opitutales bacterium]|nr:MAG: 16S rRNA (cytosine(1402)-N(4))-methyltransferase RsmH [Opitutales bacterium]
MTSHVPVLLEECLVLLAPQDGSTLLDCTFGGGGHTEAILARTLGTIVDAMDRDPAAAERAAETAARYPGRLRFHSEDFRHLDRVPGRFDGVLMDIGVSSYQLDIPERGFSFRNDGPNDMRMDPRRGRSAEEFLEQGERGEVERAVRDYGEEPRWFRVVNAIFAARGTGSLARTAAFAALVAEAAPPKPGPRGPHPATKTFQGIRIAVNDELGALTDALPLAFEKLNAGGVLAIISFHSLEDRIVKRYLNGVAGRPVDRNDSRMQDDRVKLADLLTRKATQPSEAEQVRNPRSRSARLRAIRRLAL